MNIAAIPFSSNPVDEIHKFPYVLVSKMVDTSKVLSCFHRDSDMLQYVIGFRDGSI